MVEGELVSVVRVQATALAQTRTSASARTVTDRLSDLYMRTPSFDRYDGIGRGRGEGRTQITRSRTGATRVSGVSRAQVSPFRDAAKSTPPRAQACPFPH